jgi:hypothetical protein
MMEGKKRRRAGVKGDAVDSGRVLLAVAIERLGSA